MENKSRRFEIYLPVVFSVIFIGGMFVGKFMGERKSLQYVAYPQSNKITDIINIIDRNYVDTVTKDDLIEKSIPKILEELDPHSVYIPAKDLKQVSEPLDGSFEGIGVQFNIQKDTIMVVQVISGGPSEKIGLMPGDRIVEINDSVVAGIGITNDDVIRLLKGPKGTIVNVGISRKSYHELLDFDITRDKIPLYSVDVSYMLDEEIGYIKINRFARTTYEEFHTAIGELKEKGMKKIVVDLRSNGGGYLDAAIDMIDEFLADGEMIVYTQGRARSKSAFHATKRGLCKDMPLVVLIDSWSASASEIFAGAIQDNDRGTIVGQRSFGKGLVQEPVAFRDGSAMRLTIARYYTPTGRCIQKPYENGAQDYYEDIINRYMNGEFNEQDSTHFADSLKYYTPMGKVVYGGGGIMPDIFVPLDTLGYTDYYSEVANKGLIYRFAFEYADDHRDELNKFTTASEFDQYLSKKNILGEFTDFAEENDVAKEREQIKTSAAIIKNQLKAYIARNIIDNEGFYPIIRKNDKVLEKGIGVLKGE